MRKEDMSAVALLLEAVVLILGIVYIGLQLFYGFYYHIGIFKVVMNLLIMILVYVGLSILSVYPERINRIPEEYCVGNIRKYSIRMVRFVKTIFVVGLLVPCVFDVLGIGIQSAYSLIVIGLIIAISIFYEWLIIKEIRNINEQ